MSGLKCRVGAAVVAATTLWAGAVRAAPAVVVAGPSSGGSTSSVAVVPPGTDALPAAIANQPQTTSIPLPPGVFVGLFGLASAAVARRRYLKRH